MGQKENPYVIIIVLNYNNYDDTEKCILSLQNLTYPNFSIVIVDNASSDGSVEILTNNFPEIPLLRNTINGGYAAGNNIGISYALEHNADYILIINNDATVEPDFLNHLVQYAEQFPNIGVLNARIFFPGTTEIFSAAGNFNRFLCTGQNKGAIRIKKHQTESIKKVDYACGVLMLVRSQVFREVGLLDEKFFMYFEDLEFSQRVLKRYEMAYIPQSIAYHKSGGGKGWRNYTDLYLYYHTRNRFWVFGNSSKLYKVYVTIFTTLNSIAKSALIFQNIFKNRRKTSSQLKSLWKGWRDGLLTYI